MYGQRLKLIHGWTHKKEKAGEKSAGGGSGGAGRGGEGRDSQVRDGKGGGGVKVTSTSSKRIDEKSMNKAAGLDGLAQLERSPGTGPTRGFGFGRGGMFLGG